MNLIQDIQSKLEVRNYFFKKNTLFIDMIDSTYSINLGNGLVGHCSGRYSELIHDNLIKLVGNR